MLEAAIELFSSRGYEATSIEAVLTRSGVSRGSLYHHFASKEALFAAALDRVEERVAAALVAAGRGYDDPTDALRAACGAWLELARDPVVRQIVLIDAPAAVGWQRWREIDERHAFGILKRAVAVIHGQRQLDVAPDHVAHLLLAALIEMAMIVARADRPRKAIADARRAIDLVIDSLLAGPRR